MQDSTVAIYPRLGSLSWLEDAVGNQKLLLNSKIFPFRYFHWENSSNVYEIYRTGSGVVKKQIAFWSLQKGLKFISKSQLWKRRNDFTGVLIRAGTISVPPFTIIKKRTETGQIEAEGIIVEIFEGLQKYFNFR